MDYRTTRRVVRGTVVDATFDPFNRADVELWTTLLLEIADVCSSPRYHHIHPELTAAVLHDVPLKIRNHLDGVDTQLSDLAHPNQTKYRESA